MEIGFCKEYYLVAVVIKYVSFGMKMFFAKVDKQCSFGLGDAHVVE